MKALKIGAIVLTVLVLGVVTIGILAFTPSVQTWAARRAIPNQPGLTIEFDRVAAGLSGAQVTGLRVTANGIVVSAPEVSADFSALGLLMGSSIEIGRVSARDLVIDLRAVSAPTSSGGAATGTAVPSGASVSPTPALLAQAPLAGSSWPGPNGILGDIQLPLDIRLGQLAVNGRVLLSNAQNVTFEISGGDVAPGSQGNLNWKVGFADSAAGAAVATVDATGTASVRLSPERRLEGARFSGEFNAVGPNLPTDRIRFEANAASGRPEVFEVSLSIVRPSQTDRVIATRLEYDGVARSFSGTWDAAARSEQFAALLSGLGLPSASLQGSGRFSYGLETGNASATGLLDAGVTGLGRVSTALAAVGDARVHVDFDAQLEAGIARLERIVIQADTGTGRRLADITALQRISYNVTTRQLGAADPNADLARVSLQGLPLAWIQPFLSPMSVEGGDVSLVLNVNADPSGEQARVRAVEPLVLRNLTLRDGDTTILSGATLSVRPSLDYSPDAIAASLEDLDLTLPEGDNVSGSVAASVDRRSTDPVIAFTGHLNGRLAAAIRPYLPVDTGPLALATSIEGTSQGQLLRISRASATVDRADAGLLAAIELAQPVTVNTASQAIAFATPSSAAVRLRLGSIPLPWVQTYMEGATVAGTLNGGAFDVSYRSLDDLGIDITSPLSLAISSFSLDGKPYANGLDAAINLEATKQGDTIRYSLRQLDVKSGNNPVVSAKLDGSVRLADKPTGSARGSVEADLAALLTQPILSEFNLLSRGTVAAGIDATIADAIQVSGTVSLRNLVARQGNRSLGTLETNANLSVGADGRGTVKLPITLTNGSRRSDLAVDGTFSRGAANTAFNGRISGTQVFVDDFQALAALAPSGGPAPANRTVPQPATGPFWAGYSGRIDTDIRNLAFGSYSLTSLKGVVAVTDTRLSLDNLEGSSRGSPFKVIGAMTYTPRQARPYSLTGTADVSNIDVGEILRTANPGDRPAIETLATVKANMSGTAATPAEFAERLTGQFDLTGSSGILRALGRKGEAVGTLSTVVGIVGALRGSDTTMAAADLAAEVNEMRFDRFTMHVERGADLNLRLTTLELISPTKRVTGTGNVTYREGVPLTQQPMAVQVTLAGKDSFALLLQKAGILGTTTDEKGYTPLARSFNIGGTISKPDSSQFWAMVTQAAAGRLFGR